jgi:hypothetical protein
MMINEYGTLSGRKIERINRRAQRKLATFSTTNPT